MSKYHAPALDKGLDIMEFLSWNAVPQSQSEIATGLARSPNEIYRMLICLVERGYIHKDNVSNKYSLTLKLYHLSHRHSPVDALRKAAAYQMQLLSEQTEQSCHLSILHTGKVMVISQSLSPRPISLSIQEGNLFSISRTTSGRIILSMLEEEERTRLLLADEFYIKLNQTKQNRLLKEIKLIKTQGYLIRESETTRGVTDYAVPIGTSEMGILGSLAVATLSSQHPEKASNEKIIEKIKYAVQSIYRELGISIN
jgi:DNA-binding IclR family transcriptional regulator